MTDLSFNYALISLSSVLQKSTESPSIRHSNNEPSVIINKKKSCVFELNKKNNVNFMIIFIEISCKERKNYHFFELALIKPI